MKWLRSYWSEPESESESESAPAAESEFSPRAWIAAGLLSAPVPAHVLGQQSHVGGLVEAVRQHAQHREALELPRELDERNDVGAVAQVATVMVA